MYSSRVYRMVEEWTTCMRLLSWRRHQGTMLKNCILILPVSDPAKQVVQVVKHHYRLKTVDRRRPMRHVIPIFLIMLYGYLCLYSASDTVVQFVRSRYARSDSIPMISVKSRHDISVLLLKKKSQIQQECVHVALCYLLLLKRKTDQCNNSHFCHDADKSQSPSLIGHDCAALIEYLHIRNSNKSKQ